MDTMLAGLRDAHSAKLPSPFRKAGLVQLASTSPGSLSIQARAMKATQVALLDTSRQKEKAQIPNPCPALVLVLKGLADLNRHHYLSEKARFSHNISGLLSQNCPDSYVKWSLPRPNWFFQCPPPSPRKNAAGSGIKPKAQMVIAVGLQAPWGPINTDPRLCRASSAQAWQEYLPCPAE